MSRGESDGSDEDELEDACLEGHAVFQHTFGESTWNEVDSVLKWKGAYYSVSEVEADGPFPTLRAAIEALPTGNSVVEATTEVDCEEMAVEELACYLAVDGAEEGKVLTLNGCRYEVRNGKLVRRPRTPRQEP